MALPHKSVATIDNVQFVDLTPLDISPMISKCQIKVFYLGKNRNGSYIDKDTALGMAKTLRGAPIVGYYKQDKGDFADHGNKVTIDGDGVKFQCETKPYGFVAPDAKVWFKTFDEQDEFGNPVSREYLMTDGYLWTEQFEQAKSVIDEGKPQSMELDDKSLQGHWTVDNNTGIEYFIITDAIVSKLCILGDDVEPCFEGAAVTAPEVSKTFSLDNNFKKTLFDMMQELQFALQGGKEVNTEEKKQTADAAVEEFEQKEEVTSEAPKTEDGEQYTAEEDINSDSSKSQDTGAADETHQEKNEDVDFQAKFNEVTELNKKYEQEIADLKSKYEEGQNLIKELEDFKNKVEDEKKDALITKFTMLSDEDKKDVIDNKRNYTLDEIESKLAVIGYRKGVNFNSEAAQENQKKVEQVVTVNFTEDSSLPGWVKAVKEEEKNA